MAILLRVGIKIRIVSDVFRLSIKNSYHTEVIPYTVLSLLLMPVSPAYSHTLSVTAGFSTAPRSRLSQ